MFPYAKAASLRLSIYPSVILAQWAHESYYGYSDIALRTGNLAGLKHATQSIDNGAYNGFADYKGDTGKFVQDYIRVLSINGYGYPDIKKGIGAYEQALAFSKTSYDQDHYNLNSAGSSNYITQKMEYDKLYQYDGQGSGSYVVSVPETEDKILIGLTVIAAGIGLLIASK
jgi:flagellum-specific peptidoglycan hydrolase FlgJ